jgi:stress-induced morphogen
VASAQDIKQRIEQAIPGCTVEVEDYTGTSDHFSATVISSAFEGLPRIAQHRLVYQALGEDVGGAIHALALKTQVPSAINTP